MDAVLLLARLGLASVFAVSGVAKLIDREGTTASLRAFGVPAALSAPAARLLPVAELIGAAGLIPSASAPYAAAGLLALVALFIAAIGVNLARGRRPDCHCFGQLHSKPIGAATLVRNAGLAAVAGYILWQPATVSADVTTPAASIADGHTLLLLLCVVSTALAVVSLFVVFNVLRQNGRLLLRLETIEAQLGIQASAKVEGLPVDSPAPPFDLPALDGRRVTLASLDSDSKPVLLVFSEPGCGACETLLPEVGQWQREHAGRVTTVLVSRGSVAENRERSAQSDLGLTLLQSDREVASSYAVVGTPSAVLIARGKIASPLAIGPADVRALASAALVPRLQPGDPAPRMTLLDLDGQPVSLNGSHGEATVLLFWSPTCGYCQQMLPDVLAWERGPGRAQMLLVSAGPPDLLREQAFRSPIALDDDFEAGRAFGVSGTPSAILLDINGVVGSGLAVGQAAIMRLLPNASR